MYTGEVELDPIEENQIIKVWSHLVQVKSHEDDETFPIKESEIKTEMVNEEFTGSNQNKSGGPHIDQKHAKKDKAIKRRRSILVLCTQCDYKTQNKTDHETHFLEAHLGAKQWKQETECFICNKTFPKSWSLKQHVTKAHKQPTINCDICDFYSYQEKVMQDHFKDHDISPSEVLCNECDFKTDDKLKLNNHLLIDHGRLFACNFCPLKNKQNANIIQHVERTHLREKSCSMCLVYKTTSPKRMKQHMLKSCKENKKEESCTKCLVYKTTSKKRMQRHLLNSCKGSRKKYICKNCFKYSTNSQSIMHRHQSKFCEKLKNLDPIKKEFHNSQK